MDHLNAYLPKELSSIIMDYHIENEDNQKKMLLEFKKFTRNANDDIDKYCTSAITGFDSPISRYLYSRYGEFIRVPRWIRSSIKKDCGVMFVYYNTKIEDVHINLEQLKTNLNIKHLNDHSVITINPGMITLYLYGMSRVENNQEITYQFSYLMAMQIRLFPDEYRLAFARFPSGSCYDTPEWRINEMLEEEEGVECNEDDEDEYEEDQEVEEGEVVEEEVEEEEVEEEVEEEEEEEEEDEEKKED